MKRASRVLIGALLVAAIAACEKTPTRPTNRRPVIHSVVAFPLVLGLGDSMVITVNATDPDGDTLVYDWEAYNGLTTEGAYGGMLYHTPSPSRVFYLASRPATYDTAFVWCGVRDVKGGGDSEQIIVTLN